MLAFDPEYFIRRQVLRSSYTVEMLHEPIQPIEAEFEVASSCLLCHMPHHLPQGQRAASGCFCSTCKSVFGMTIRSP
jgi:hypothetical protein